MWFWVLVIFAVGGALLGFFGSENGEEKEGAFGGCLTGLFAGGSCLVRILIFGLCIMFCLWLFGFLFG